MGDVQSMDTKLDFARRLHEALDGLRVDTRLAERKRYLARILGVTERQIGNYFAGKKLPDPERWTLLATQLGVSLDWLLTGRGPKRPLSAEELQHIESTRTLAVEDQKKVYRLSTVFEPDNHNSPTKAA
jgi:transcriptional regulator with XRE-family HTH domain